MLTTRNLQNTNPNESGVQFSEALSSELRAALETAGVDLDAVRAEPDGTVYVALTDGRIAIGEDDGWITATRHGEDGEYTAIYDGESVADLAAAVATAAR